jgi:beta-glucosidase
MCETLRARGLAARVGALLAALAGATITLVAASATAATPATPQASSVHPSLWPPGPQRPLDATLEAQVNELFEQLSLEEKVGQMVQADIASIRPADLATYRLGSVLAGGNAAPDDNVRSSAAAWAALVDEYHRAALTPAPGTHHAPIPLLFGIDAVHGLAKVKGATIFPHNVALGAAHDPDLVRRIGAATAEEVAATGIDWTFAPTVAVVRDVRWGRSYESYSEEPALVREYAAAFVTGLQGAWGGADFLAPGHTLGSVKHFIGDGGTTDGRDQGNTVLPEIELARVHAAGYYGALGAGAQIVMASYNRWNGIKVHGHQGLLTGILKGRMSFDGFVVGDWNAHEQLPGCTKSDCPAAINAGVDMLMAPDAWQPLYRNLLDEARSGVIPRARIDDAVRRILRVKARAGLLVPRPAQPHDLSVLGSAPHRELARQAVRESLVLLKNEAGLLPLAANTHVLVAGDAADDIGRQSGGWTLDWQGAHNRNEDFPGATSIYAGIRALVTAAGGTVELAPAGGFSHRPDVAIVVFGEEPYAEFEGDRENLDFSAAHPRPLALLHRLRTEGIRTVSVFLSGRPLWVNPELNVSDAFIAAWLPGSEGEGVADLLFRTPDGAVREHFTGRLAFSWPRTAMPVKFDAPGRARDALFPVGYGLDGEPRSASGTLSEDPQIAPGYEAKPGQLFADGHPTAPNILFVADGGDEVHVTGDAQRSPHGAVEATLGAGGVSARWQGPQVGSLLISGRVRDLEPAARRGALLKIRYRLDQPPASAVRLGMHCLACGAESGRLDLSATLARAPLGQWQSLEVPLSCLAPQVSDLEQIDAPFVLSSSGSFALTLAQIELALPAPASSAPALPCP